MALKELCDPQAVLCTALWDVFWSPPDAWIPNILLLLFVVRFGTTSQGASHTKRCFSWPGFGAVRAASARVAVQPLVALAAGMLTMLQQKVEVLNHTGLHGCFVISTHKNGGGTGR